MKIKAAISSPLGGEFKIEQVELEQPRENEILVQINSVGLCHTDIVGQMGAFEFGAPAVLGHEGAGIVEQIGDNVTKVAVGDRVTISFASCGQCPKCTTNHPAYCHSMPALNYAGMRPDGSRSITQNGKAIASNFFGQSSFATHALTFERNVVKIPDDIPFDIAAPLGCGIQTGAGSIINSLNCEEGSSLVIAGGGTVGLSAVMGGCIQQCNTIIVIEPLAVRRELALKLGATHVINPIKETNITDSIKAILPNGTDYSLDTTGREDVLEVLVSSLAPQGTLGCVGIAAPGTKVPGDYTQLLSFGHTIKGIIEGDCDPDKFIPKLIDYYKKGKLPIDELITTYPFSDINQAVADQHEGKCVKAVFNFN